MCSFAIVSPAIQDILETIFETMNPGIWGLVLLVPTFSYYNMLRVQLVLLIDIKDLSYSSQIGLY